MTAVGHLALREILSHSYISMGVFVELNRMGRRGTQSLADFFLHRSLKVLRGCVYVWFRLLRAREGEGGPRGEGQAG